MSSQQTERDVAQLAERVRLAEELIRSVEDDALPPAALPAWQRYRERYPRDGS